MSLPIEDKHLVAVDNDCSVTSSRRGIYESVGNLYKVLCFYTASLISLVVRKRDYLQNLAAAKFIFEYLLPAYKISIYH